MQIIQFSKNDLEKNAEKFCNLYKKVFTAKIDQEILRQRYIDHYSEDFLMVVALENEKIIANYSAIPIALMINGEEKKAALSLNTMVDPDYQGKGMIILLARKLYGYMAAQNYDLLYGFPNGDSNRMFNDGLGWKTVYEIPTLKLAVSDIKKPYDINCKIEQDKYDCIKGNVLTEKIHTKLSEDYIAWRYKNNKEKQYHLLSIDENNWVIYQRYHDEINITEIDCSDNRKAHELIKAVINIAIKERYAFVTTWYSINTKIHSYLETIGFKIASPVRTFGVRCFNREIEDTVLNYNRWKLCMGNDNTY